MSEQQDELEIEEGGRFAKLRPAPRTLSIFLLGMVVALVGTMIFLRTRETPEPLSAETLNNQILEVMASATPPPARSSLVYQVILPSLIIIQTERSDSAEDGFGVGTGVVINEDGSILTSLHVVDGADRILVTFADGNQSEAVLADSDPDQDIALLQPLNLRASFIPAILGGGLNIGDEIYAVGNPLGLAGSMSAGVVSGLDRSFRPVGSDTPIQGMIQFDAAVNPGNSGGPLLDRNGHVTGIVTGLINPTEQDVFIGIGFAVPIEVAVTAAGGGPAQ